MSIFPDKRPNITIDSLARLNHFTVGYPHWLTGPGLLFHFHVLLQLHQLLFGELLVFGLIAVAVHDFILDVGDDVVEGEELEFVFLVVAAALLG